MQRMEKLQQKLNDETMKKHEYDNIVQKNEMLKQLNDQKTNEDKSYKEYMNSQYVKKIEEREMQSRLRRDKEKEEEKINQERIKQDLEFEKQIKTEDKEKARLEMELLLKYKHVMTEQEKQNLEKTR